MTSVKYATVLVWTILLLIMPLTSMEPEVRIIGGRDAKDGQFPFQVMIMNLKTGFPAVQYQICGGTIISNRRIVSAAHCFYKHSKLTASRQIRVAVGTISVFNVTVGCVMHKIRKVFVHENYKNITQGKDLAVLETKYEIEFGPYISKLPIASDSSVYAIGQECTLVGWGRQICSDMDSIPSYLQYAIVKVIDVKTCELFYLRVDTDLPKIICAGHGVPQSSIGDSGGPLVCNASLAGIVSTGPSCQFSLQGPVVYVNAHAYEDWILSPTSYHNFKIDTGKLIINLSFFLIVMVLIAALLAFLYRGPVENSGLETPFLTSF